uniref:Uncharacterized protein n=1 Tax=Vitis vinifera TaxID=29760 RepID=A5BX63_VITVI|nr:hypothetical protein VITISV_002850 [Vitis vinifera]
MVMLASRTAFLSPKQSEIQESSLESISKSRIQGVWDPAHSTRTGIIAHSTRVGITSGCRHYTWLPPLHPVAATFHLDVHIRNSTIANIPPGCFTSGILTPDGRGGQTNFEDFSSQDERLDFSSLGVRKAGRACYIEYEIAEEAINFMSYVAEFSRRWDEPNARDLGRMTSQPNAKGEMYILNDGIDMRTKFAAMERRLDELEMKNMQEVQAISQTPLQAMPCAICLSYEHLGEECPSIPAVREIFGD